MRILFYASHLLMWRPLIPVACELSGRGHKIVVQTNRPNWLGMPTWQMHWRPTKVTGVNKTSLTWLAEKIGYSAEWKACEPQYGLCKGMAVDVSVTTTKDLKWARGQVEMGYQAFAIGYQHFPVVMEVGVGPHTWAYMPQPFWYEEPFAKLHHFERMMAWGRGRSCGFPHLDKMVRQQKFSWGMEGGQRPSVFIQDPGNGRGIETSEAHNHLLAVCWSLDYRVVYSQHWLHGLGDLPYAYDQRALARAIAGSWDGGNPLQVVDHWWPWVAGAACVLTFGSSMIYELWSLGITNVYVVGFVGGDRWKKFEMFPDIVIRSEADLDALLTNRLMGLPRRKLTEEVMQAFRDVHDGQGAKTAADFIEGKR